MGKGDGKSILVQLDQPVLAALLVSQAAGLHVTATAPCCKTPNCPGTRDTFAQSAFLRGFCCPHCHQSQLAAWRKAADEIEQALVAAGWGPA